MKYIPFTIVCPELKPGQGVLNKKIMVEVREEGEHEVLTAEAMQLIEATETQMMLTRLYSCVRELYAAIGVLPSRDPKATENVTAQGCANSPTVVKSEVRG